jgi:hypothetical protein
MNDYHRQWYLKNKERILAQQKIYEKENRLKINIRRRRYYQKNREKILFKVRERYPRYRIRQRKYYYEIFKKEHPNYYKQWYKENKAKKIEMDKNWIKNHPQVEKSHSLARRIKIPKGQLCEICNLNLAKVKHHPNHNKYYEVIFACFICHNKLDRKEILISPSLLKKVKDRALLFA